MTCDTAHGSQGPWVHGSMTSKTPENHSETGLETIAQPELGTQSPLLHTARDMPSLGLETGPQVSLMSLSCPDLKLSELMTPANLFLEL